MKRTAGIEEILCVDVNESVLEASHEKVAPLISEYISRRPIPLVVEIYKGSVTQNDRKLENTDAVICIELWVAVCYSQLFFTLVFKIIENKNRIFMYDNHMTNIDILGSNICIQVRWQRFLRISLDLSDQKWQ